jgi:hypothetical protein
LAAKPEWLNTGFVLAQFGTQRARAIAKYVAFVHEGRGLPSVWEGLKGQIFLGSEKFIQKMEIESAKKPSLVEVPRAQRRAMARELAEYAGAYERNEAIAMAFLSGHHTMAAMADYFGVHSTTVSRLVKGYEGVE